MSSYEHDGKPYCHLDYHEVHISCFMNYCVLTSHNHRNSRRNATIVERQLLTSGLSHLMIPHSANGRTTSSTFSVPNVVIHFLHQLFQGGDGMLAQRRRFFRQMMMLGLRCIRATPIARRAMCVCVTPSANAVRRVLGTVCKLLKLLAESGVGSAFCVR